MYHYSDNSIWKMLNDLANKQGITEIVINDPERVFVERNGQFIQLNVELIERDFLDFAYEVAEYNQLEEFEKKPILDGRLPDGSRINIVGPPYTENFPAITIRKYLREIKTFDTSPNVFGLSKKWIIFFKSLVKARANIFLSGGTGVGKTTFLNLLLQEINPMERVVTIEDTLELYFDVPNIIRLEAKNKFGIKHDAIVTIRDLIKNTLRMRPDRIIVGETRGGELFDLLQAMNTGHEGSMTSIHANSPSECITRIENLYQISGLDVPVKAIRKQMSDSIDFIIQLERDRDGIRSVSEIMELTGMEENNIQVQTIANMEDGVLSFSGLVPTITNRLKEYGNLPRDFFI